MTLTDSHVLLGAGGSIATVLAPLLAAEGRRVRLVSRSGHAVAGMESVRANLLDPQSVMQAIDEGATAYLLAGLPYATGVWQDQWPRVMRNVIEACVSRHARLIFFDNVYMYGQVDGSMTEDTHVNPSSRKGEIRARIARELMAAASAGRLKACIARAADFYGPGGRNSVPNILVFKPLAKGQRPQWLVNADIPHSFTYVPDCGPALRLLAETEDAWGRVWHLPTAAPPLTGREFVTIAARAFGASPQLTVLAPWMIRLSGLFRSDIRESVEMLYQNARPYVFDSSRFEQRFGVRATTYVEGIAITARSYEAGQARA